MKFKHIKYVTMHFADAEVKRFIPLHISYLRKNQWRWLAIFIFGEGPEICWSRNCPCRDCRLERYYVRAAKLLRFLHFREETVNEIIAEAKRRREIAEHGISQ